MMSIKILTATVRLIMLLMVIHSMATYSAAVAVTSHIIVITPRLLRLSRQKIQDMPMDCGILKPVL